MTLQEIFQMEAPNQIVTELQNRRFIDQPDVEQAVKALDPEKHDVNDRHLRPDKIVAVTDENGEQAKTVITNADGTEDVKVKTRPEKVARVALALQRLIVNRAVSFIFGNPPKFNATPETDDEKAVMTALNRINYDVKASSLNRRVARSVLGFKECAEYWYTVECKHNTYGFLSKNKLKCAVFSPMFGDKLYPYFDETGDMTAFSRAFGRHDAIRPNEITDYFETWTSEQHYLWRRKSSDYELVEGYPQNNPIGKIPVVWGYQPFFETEFVDKLISRLEFLLSNFADTNDYHAAPKIFCTGQINGWSKKGDSGAVIEGEDGATMQYVSWQQAPEAVKLEIETLLKMIYTITQTPDISFDSVKGLNLSGVALKLLFMDAHLKVQDKREVFDEYLQRRVNIQKAYIAKMNTKLEEACDNLLIEPEIVPYIITSDKDDLEFWMAANGGEPVISQEESIENAGLSKNPELTKQKIDEERNRQSSFMVGEPIAGEEDLTVE